MNVTDPHHRRILIEIITPYLEDKEYLSVKKALKNLSRKGRFVLHETKLDDERLEELMALLGVEEIPIILINGRLLFAGRPSEKELVGLIKTAMEQEKDSYSYYL